MDPIKDLQKEVQNLRWNIYTLAYAIDDLVRRVEERERENQKFEMATAAPVEE